MKANWPPTKDWPDGAVAMRVYHGRNCVPGATITREEAEAREKALNVLEWDVEWLDDYDAALMCWALAEYLAAMGEERSA